MPGLYIHIPFCRKACTYCNFHFSTTLNQKAEMVEMIASEIKGFKSRFNTPETAQFDADLAVDTIYFGGGTPGLLTENELGLLLDTLHSVFTVSQFAEITLETNPDDHTGEKMNMWKARGVNRLSIGVQSFFEDDLLWMNRAHNATQSLDSVKAAQDSGFNDLTVDLIYGMPGLTDERWKYNFDTAVASGVNHLSCYALTVEPKTALDSLINKGRSQPMDAEQQARQFLVLMEWARAAGFEHYEISNFAKPGHRSRHNTSYWQGKPYFGFGPSAHSFDGNKTRWWNIANNSLYIKAMQEQLPVFESEALTQVQQLNEYLMTGLRTVEGISLSDNRWDDASKKSVLNGIKKWEQSGKLLSDENHFSLTDEGKLYADGIAADLFV